MSVVRIATRASELALVQARHVAGRLEALLGVETELVPMKTSGDRLADVSLAKIGGKGLFVREIEEALLDGRADLAVHSAKDLPAAVPPGLELVAFPPRADARDALVGERFDGLRRGARVGTGSARRSAQLRAARPDVEIVPLRGNVPTRLRKRESESLDAVVLACAGLDRLGLADPISERIDPAQMLPAVAQGALAVQGRADDPVARDAAALGDPATTACVAAERGFLAGLGGDCNTPLAAYAELAGGELHLRVLLASTDGSRLIRRESRGPQGEAAALGAAAAEAVLGAGGDALLAALRAEAGA